MKTVIRSLLMAFLFIVGVVSVLVLTGLIDVAGFIYPGASRPHSPSPALMPATVRPAPARAAHPELRGTVESIHRNGEEIRLLIKCESDAGTGLLRPDQAGLAPLTDPNIKGRVWVNIDLESMAKDGTGVTDNLARGQRVRVRYDGWIFITLPLQVTAESILIEND